MFIKKKKRLIYTNLDCSVGKRNSLKMISLYSASKNFA